MNKINIIKKMEVMYRDLHPSKSLLKILRNFLIYNWSGALVNIFFLIFGAMFAKIYINYHFHDVTSSEVVTSLGLSFLWNNIIYLFAFGFSVSSSVFYVNRMGKNDHTRHKEWFGTYTGIKIPIIILISLITAFFGKYIVYLQNNNLPSNYKVLIQTIMYCFAISFPFSAIYAAYVSHLSSEGSPWILTVAGVSFVAPFICLSWLFFETNSFSFVKNHGARIAYDLGIAFAISYLFADIMLFISGLYLKKTQGSFFTMNINNIKKFNIKYAYLITINALPIFTRGFSVIVSAIFVNIILNYVYIPKHSYSPEGSLPNNSIYWQFLTAALSPILIFVLKGMWSFSGSSRYLHSYNISNKNYKNIRETFKWTFIYVSMYLFFAEIIIISAAPFILQLFGIIPNAKYQFLMPNGQYGVFISNGLYFQSIIITRIFFSSVIFLGIQPVITSYAIASKNKLLSYFVLCLDKVILEIPLFVLFAFFSRKFELYYLAWVSYVFCDFVSFLIIGVISIKIINNIRAREGIKKIKLLW